MLKPKTPLFSSPLAHPSYLPDSFAWHWDTPPRISLNTQPGWRSSALRRATNALFHVVTLALTQDVRHRRPIRVVHNTRNTSTACRHVPDGAAATLVSRDTLRQGAPILGDFLRFTCGGWQMLIQKQPTKTRSIEVDANARRVIAGHRQVNRTGNDRSSTPEVRRARKLDQGHTAITRNTVTFGRTHSSGRNSPPHTHTPTRVRNIFLQLDGQGRTYSTHETTKFPRCEI